MTYQLKYPYQVQEFVAGKWWPVQSYSNEQEAKAHAAKLSRARVVKL